MIFSSSPCSSLPRFLEDRLAPGAPINPIEHQAVQMDVQFGGRAESLDQGDRAGIGCGAFLACLLEQKPRDDAVDDPQHRREQLGVCGEEDAQPDRKRPCAPARRATLVCAPVPSGCKRANHDRGAPRPGR